MLQVNKNFTEAAHVADELMSVDELTRKYFAVQRTVKRGVFSLDEALKAYEVSKESYSKFVDTNERATLSKDSTVPTGPKVIGIFDYISEAQNAISFLVGSGLNRDNIDLSSREVIIINENDAHSKSRIGVNGFFSSLFGTSDETDNYAHVGQKGFIVTVYARSSDEAENVAQILDNYGAIDVNERAKQYKSGNISGMGTVQPAKTNEGDSIKIIKEKMEVGKREVETAGVRLRSRIVEQAVHEDIRLRTERVRVDRTNVSRSATAADLAGFQDATVEMKETAEVPVVSKQAFVTGEVSLGKEVSEKNQTVEGTVRKTEVDTENFTNQDTKLSSGNTKTTRNEGGSFYK